MGCGSSANTSKPQKTDPILKDDPNLNTQDLKDYSRVDKMLVDPTQKQQKPKSEEELRKRQEELANKIKKENEMYANASLFTNTLNESQKNELKDIIMYDDIEALEVKMKSFNASVQEDLIPGYFWNGLHLCCSQNAYCCLELLLKKVFAAKNENVEEYQAVVNAQSAEGWTPLMVAANKGNLECLDVFKNAGGCKTELKDSNKRTAFNIANFEKKKVFASALKDATEQLETVHVEWLKELNENTIKELGKKPKKNYMIHVKLDPKSLDILKSNLSEENKNSRCAQILAEKINENKNFEDPEFKHEITSLTLDNCNKYYSTFKLAKWMRPHELFDCEYDQIKLFDEIDPNDIRQGSLAICYFLAVLSALAEFPERVKNIFVNTEANSYGVYSVIFHFKGIRQEIVVDDYIPCFASKKEPLFSKPNGKELWVLILEKAYCKYFKNYGVTEFEVVDYAMEDILGTPAYGIITARNTPEQLWEKLLTCDQKNYLMSATSSKAASKDQGIVPSHAYTVISLFEFPNNIKLLKLRNPWGNFEWKGLYSDESNNWTEELKQTVKYVNADDGVFFMTIDEFHKNFPYISICVFNEGWVLKSYTAKSDYKHAAYYKFTLTEPMDVYLRVHQDNERLYRESDLDYDYSPVEFMLFKENGDLYEEIHCGNIHRYLGAKSVNISSEEGGVAHLEPGNYFLRIKIHWIDYKFSEFVLTSYSPKPFVIEQIPKEEGKLVLYKSYAFKAKNQEKHKVFLEGGTEKIIFLFGWHNQHCYLYFENIDSEDWKPTLKILDGYSNCYMHKKWKSPTQKNTFLPEIKPNSYEICIMKRVVMHEACAFNWRYLKNKV